MAIVGSAHIRISPDTKGFGAQMKKALEGTRGVANKAGDDAGKSYGGAFDKAMDSALSKVRDRMSKAGKDAGKGFGDTFGAEVKKSTDKTFKDVEAAANRSGKAAGEGFQKGFTGALRNLGTAMNTSFRGLERESGASGQRAGAAWADGFQREAGSRLSGMGGVVADSFRGSFLPRMGTVGDEAFEEMGRSAAPAGDKAGTSFGNALKSAALSMIRKLGSGGGGGVFDALPSSAGRSGGKAGGLFSDQFGNLLKKALPNNAQAAADKFTTMFAKAATTGTALAGLLGTLSAAASSLVPVAGALAQIASAGTGAIGVLGALAQGGIAVGIAFKGVFAAIGAGAKAANAGTSASSAGVIAAQRRIEDARARIAETRVRNQQRIEDAARRVLSAENTYTAAQNRALTVQDKLNEARKTAAQRLEDMKYSLEGAALSERRAMLNLEDAEAALAKVAGQPVDSTARREAQLAYEEAALAAKLAVKEHEEVAAAKEEADKAGVEGSKEVIDADNARKDALDDIKKAEDDLAQAREEARRAGADGDRDLAKAKTDLARATDDAKRAQDAGNSAAAEYQKSMDKLSLSAQTFVEKMLSLRDRMNDFKKAVQQPFFEKFNASIDPLVNTLLDELETKLVDTSGIMGTMASQLAGALVSNTEAFGKMLEFNNGILAKFTAETSTGNSAVENLVNVFFRLGEAIQPVTTMFADWLVKLTESMAAATDSKKEVDGLAATFERAGRIIGNIGGIIAAVWDAAKPAVESIMVALDTGLANLRGSAESNIGAMANYFNGVVENMKPLMRIIGEVLKIFVGLGDDKNIGKMWTELEKGLPALQTIVSSGTEAGPALATLVVSVANLLAAFAKTGALDLFFKTLTIITDALGAIFNNEGVQKAMTVLGPILAVFSALRIVAMGLNFVWAIFGGKLLGIWKIFGFLWNIISKVIWAIRIVGAVISLLGLGPIALVVAAIGALIAIFVVLYKKNEGFRNFVDGLVAKAKELWDKFVEFLGGIGDAWDKMWSGIQEAWDKYGAPVLEVIKTAFKIFFLILSIPIAIWIAVWTWLWKQAVKAWEDFGKPLIDTIVGLWQGFVTTISGIWGGIKKLFSDAWEAIKTWYKDNIKDWVDNTLIKPWNDFKTKVERVWNSIKDAASDGWKKLTDWWTQTAVPWMNSINPFNGIGETIGKAFSSAKHHAGNALNSLINFLNDFVIKNLNTVTKVFGVTIDRIDPVKVPALEKAAGGYITGPGGPTDDKIPARLSNGEYVVRAASVRKYGKGALDAINRGTAAAGTGGLRDLPIVGDLLSSGARATGEWIINKTLNPLVSMLSSDSGIVAQLARGLFQKLPNALLNWITGEEKKNPPEGASGGGPTAGGASGPKLGGKWYNPVYGSYNVSRIWHPSNGGYWAADMAGAVGTPIVAIAGGRIVRSTFAAGSYGNYVVIDHGAMKSLYAHMVRSGRGTGPVVAGQVLGYRGNTGKSYGAHLHFEVGPAVYASGSNYNPRTFMGKQGVRLATGGVVKATPGGVMAMLAEGGKHERVEPLDSQGLSARDRALITELGAKFGGGGGSGPVSVRVFIGDQELRSMVRYEVSDNQRTLARDLSIGRRTR